MRNYIFVDESGDPGEPFKTDKNNKFILDSKGNKIKTGASDGYVKKMSGHPDLGHAHIKNIL
jgi:hypothetical protein